MKKSLKSSLKSGRESKLDPSEKLYRAKVKCEHCGKRATVYAVKEHTLREILLIIRDAKKKKLARKARAGVKRQAGSRK